MANSSLHGPSNKHTTLGKLIRLGQAYMQNIEIYQSNYLKYKKYITQEVQLLHQ